MEANCLNIDVILGLWKLLFLCQPSQFLLKKIFFNILLLFPIVFLKVGPDEVETGLFLTYGESRSRLQTSSMCCREHQDLPFCCVLSIFDGFFTFKTQLNNDRESLPRWWPNPGILLKVPVSISRNCWNVSGTWDSESFWPQPLLKANGSIRSIFGSQFLCFGVGFCGIWPRL